MDQNAHNASKDLSESRTFSFVIKIWLEEAERKTGLKFWRGHITHVPGGKRQYIQNLEDILLFIAPYIEAAGVKPGYYWRFRQWFKQRMIK